MKISVSDTLIRKNHDYETAVKMLKTAGVEAIDFDLSDCWHRPSFWQGIIPEDCIFTHPLEDIIAHYKPWLDTIRNAGIKVEMAHAPFPSAITDRPEVVEYVIPILKNCVRYCDAVGFKKLVVHGVSMEVWEKAMDFKTLSELNDRIYTSLIPQLKGTDVIVCLEDMFASDGNQLVRGHSASAYETCIAIDKYNALCDGEEHFGYCLDSGHLQLLNTDMRKFINKLGKRIKCLHLHDTFCANKDNHLIPYFGRDNFKGVLQGLKDIGYDGDINFETSYFERVPKPLAQPFLNILGGVGRYFIKVVKGEVPIE